MMSVKHVQHINTTYTIICTSLRTARATIRTVLFDALWEGGLNMKDNLFSRLQLRDALHHHARRRARYLRAALPG